MKTNPMFTGVQALRFVAAMLVVCTHATGMVSERLLHRSAEDFWQAGMSGVDLFFVISGFVMTLTTGSLIGRIGGWKKFLARRILRIVPLYWLATTFKIVLLLVFTTLPRNTPFDLWHLTASYLFIPTFNHEAFLFFPVMQVGWTLNYEMLFYALIALSLFLRLPVLAFTAAVLVIFTAINIFSSPGFSYGYGFLNPIMLEFVMGMLVAKLCQRGYTVNPWVGGIAVLSSFAIMFSSGHLPIWWRWIYWGLPSMIIVAVAALSESVLRNTIPNLLVTLGDSSYSLYLFHTFTIPLLGALFVKFHLANPVVAVIESMIISPVVGLIVYKWLELPMTQYFKHRSAATFESPSVVADIQGV